MSITWDGLRAACKRIAEERGEWGGAPLPVQGLRLCIEPRYPFQGLNGFCFGTDEDERNAELERAAEAIAEHLTEKTVLVNSWYCFKHDAYVYVWHNGDGRSRRSMLPERYAKRYRLQFNAIAVASEAHSLDAELKAIETLREHVTEQAWKLYMLCGMFLETSPRSKIIYMFRKGRPTLALAVQPDGNVRPIVALCLHPIGYYEDSFSGVMVPTDDVISHLLMMRGDERKFWSKANHHPLWAIQSGI